MVKAKVIAFALALLSLTAAAQDFQWRQDRIDGSRTGVTVPKATNVEEALGKVSGRKYIAPNGKVYRGGSVSKVAGLVLDAQPEMAEMKVVIAYAPEAMDRAEPECAITNWFIDNLMDEARACFGKKVDVGIGNFGGVRLDMPQGDIILDDIRSMFPFKNNLCYVALRGKDLRKILEGMAATRFQILGGVKIVANNGKLVSVKVGGKALDDKKIYGVATISFLLDGGDGLFVARNAVEVIDGERDIFEAIMDRINNGPKAENGFPLIAGQCDGRVIVLDKEPSRQELY